MKRKTKIFVVTLVLIFLLSIVTVTVKATSDVLVSNGGIISSAQITVVKTGTADFDEDDTAGNDSSEDNDIVRSFDSVTWTIENTMVVNGTGASSYSGGKMYFEAVLPDTLNSTTAKWDTDSMPWIEDINVSTDGRTLTGYYQMSEAKTTVPGKQSLEFKLNVYGAGNGTEFAPIFKIWLEGNEEKDYATVTSKTITVSATPKYNLKLVKHVLANKVSVDLDDDGVTETTGRMYGYSVVTQLYNDDKSRGLKGIEYPTGDFNFDITLKLERTLENSTSREDITDECTPILWNYKINKSSTYGNISTRNMTWGNTANYDGSGAPYGIATSDRNNSVYDSGEVYMEQNGSTISVRAYNYDFDSVFPKYNNYYLSSTSIVFDDNVGCFGVYYFQFLVPDNEASLMEDRSYYLVANETNLNATGLSGTTVTEQEVTTDDNSRVQHLIHKTGTYSKHMDLLGNTNIIDRGRNLDTYLAPGNTFNAVAYINLDSSNDKENDIYTANQFVKFDSSALEPVNDLASENFSSDLSKNSDMKFKGWFVCKKDGTNWLSDEEMCNSSIEDMLIYESLSAMPDGYICVGMYFESISGHLEPVYNDNIVKLKIKEDATPGKTYAIVQDIKLWIDSLDRSVYTVTNENVEYPKATSTMEHTNYIKAEYDENGVLSNKSTVSRYQNGQTVYVVGSNQKISLKAIDLSTGEEVLKYNLGKNENEVTYKITPELNQGDSGVTVDIDNVTVTITDTLPSGLTYISGSCDYEEPEITTNDDGSSTLVWKIYGCKVGDEMADITFKAKIKDTLENGTVLTNTAVISADADKVGNARAAVRTATSSIQVTNLASHRLFKVSSEPVVELGAELNYQITYQNNTDNAVSDFVLLDILPYDGDSRGSNFSGTYTLKSITVTRYDANNNIITDDNITAYYINDESVRSIDSKDTSIGDNTWTEITSEEIKTEVTAIALKGTASAQERIVVDVCLEPKNNRFGDVYVNIASAQTSKTTEEIVSSSAKIQVVQRKIEGYVFYDKNNNGVKDESEVYVQDVEMSLTDGDGNAAIDVYGNEVVSVKTDENGYYSFEGLSVNTYYVKITLPDGYALADKQIGTNDEINSKFDINTLKTDKITKLNTTALAELTVSNLNAGIIKKGSITVTKVDKSDESIKIEGATFKVERLDSDGNVDTSFTAIEKTTDETGVIKFEELRIGKYRVTETQAPAGYNLSENYIEVELTDDENDISILAKDRLRLVLPNTGKVNIVFKIVLVGILVISISFILKKEK